MKKSFTLFGFFLTVTLAFGQTLSGNIGAVRRAYPANKIEKPIHHSSSSNGSRATTSSFYIDYDGYDESYATYNSFGYDQTLVQLNTRVSKDSLGFGRYAIVFYDSLVDLDNNPNWPHNKIPYSAVTNITVDTLIIGVAHVKNSAPGIQDTLRLRIFDGTTITSLNRDEGITVPHLWEYVLPIDTSITGAGSQPGQYQVRYITVPVNTTVPGRFAIQADFYGPIEDEFFLLSGYRNDCGFCVASISSIGSKLPLTGFNRWNSLVNYAFAQPQTLFSPELYYGGNGGGTCQPSSGAGDAFCNYDYTQNIIIAPRVTVNVDYGVGISADSLFGCPNTTIINLSANGFGSSAVPYDYQWSTTSGTLSTTQGEDVSLIMGNGNAVVTVTVTDASSVTASASVTVTSRAINVTITNPSPVTLACGQSVTLLTTTSGTQTGRRYTWSTGQSGPSVPSVPVTQAGTYSVTVTNNAGCSSSASVNVVYPDVTNNVSFDLPVGPIQAGVPATFTNTSTKQGNGWTADWSINTNPVTTYTNTLNATHQFDSPGSYVVTLTMDSAGCKFSFSRAVTVGFTSIVSVDFGSGINLQPNPSNGNLTLTVNDAEKNISIRVYNVIGSEVRTFTSNEVSSTFSRTFDFSDLSSGTYLMKIQSANKVAVKRFTISK